jgi:hypothetical protein
MHLCCVQVKLVIFPASMSVDETVAMVKDSESKHLSTHSLQMIYTGAICPIKEVFEYCHFDFVVVLFDLNHCMPLPLPFPPPGHHPNDEQCPLLPPVSTQSER